MGTQRRYVQSRPVTQRAPQKIRPLSRDQKHRRGESEQETGISGRRTLVCKERMEVDGWGQCIKETNVCYEMQTTMETEPLSKGSILIRGLDFTLKVLVGRTGFNLPSGQQALQSHCFRMMTLLLSSCVTPATSFCFLICEVGITIAPQAHRVLRGQVKQLENCPAHCKPQ